MGSSKSFWLYLLYGFPAILFFIVGLVNLVGAFWETDPEVTFQMQVKGYLQLGLGHLAMMAWQFHDEGGSA